VLVVDDSATIRSLVRVHLMGLGLEFVEAASGEEALLEIERSEFDLVLLDLHMPGIDGLAVLRAIRANEKPEVRRVKIVVLTGDKSDAAVAEARHAGADDFVLKPVTRSNLIEATSRCLDQKI